MRAICLLLVVVSVFTPRAAETAQDPIAAAKELYASAAYEEALTALRAVRDNGSEEVARQADEYIAFCLLALGKTAEAELAAESAVRRNPLASIDARDASPRIEAMFTQVRKRLLPGMIRDSYRSAREAMNQGNATDGMEGLARVRLMLDAAKALDAWDETLADMSVLVDGFLDLSRAAAAQRTPAPAAAVPAPATIPPVVTSGQAALSAKPSPPAKPSQPAYNASDADVTPPVVVRQDIPEVTLDSPTRATKRSGVIEVTIDERGGVRSAVMRESISLSIDAQLLKAARSWLYRPATRGGVPVPYIKVIGIAIGN